jgi:hypothetical protein
LIGERPGRREYLDDRGCADAEVVHGDEIRPARSPLASVAGVDMRPPGRPIFCVVFR